MTPLKGIYIEVIMILKKFIAFKRCWNSSYQIHMDLTKMKKGYEKFIFSFKNADGKTN